MPRIAKTLPEFAAVWQLLVGQADTHMRLKRSDASDRITATRSLSDPAGAIEAASRIAKATGVRVPNLRALEAGLAFQLSLQKLVDMNRKAARLKRTKVSERAAEDVDQVMDLWLIYVDRYVDATAKFAQEVAKSLFARKVQSDIRKEVEVWRKGKKDALAIARNEIAHANTNYIRAIHEEGMWEPMILHGFAGTEQLEQIAGQNANFTNSFFNRRQPSLRTLTGQAIAEGEVWCKTLVERFHS